MNSHPYLSVIVPMYNSEKFIGRTLDSICCQTFSDIEILCVDDFSTDSTVEICTKRSIDDNRIKIIRNLKNKGVSYSRNIGIENALGVYVAFVDHDDYLEPTMYEKLIDKLAGKDIDVVHCNVQMHFNGDVYKSLMPERFSENIQNFFLKNILIDQLKSNFPYGQFSCTIWNKIYKIETLRRNNIFFKSERELGYEDFIFNLELFVKTDKIEVCTEPLYHHVYYSTSLSRASSYVDLDLTCKNWFFTESIIKDSVFKDNEEIYKCFLYRVWAQMVFSVKNDIVQGKFSRIMKLIKNSFVSRSAEIIEIKEIRFSFACNVLSYILYFFVRLMNIRCKRSLL